MSTVHMHIMSTGACSGFPNMMAQNLPHLIFDFLVQRSDNLCVALGYLDVALRYRNLGRHKLLNTAQGTRESY